MEAKQLKLTFLLAVLMSMVGAKAFAHDFAVANGDGKAIYYKYKRINNSTEVEVSYRGSSSSSYSNEYSGVVNIPESVTYDGETYPVTSIGESAFSSCKGLTSVTIPNSVTSIGTLAFGYCSGLTEINVDENNTAYSSIDGVVFNKSQTELVCYLGGKQGAYTIPNSVTSIGSKAFSGCSGLTSITIPSSVTSIGSKAFSGCSGLTSVTINSNAIASKTYTESYSMKDIFGEQVNQYVLGDSVKSIGGYAFRFCSSLTSVTIPNSVTSIGSRAFYNCTGLTSIEIPNSVTSIGSEAFYKCTGLTSIEIPNSVTSIEGSAFSGCRGLTSVTIGNSVTSIGSEAFSYCSGLTSIEIPNSVTSIGYKAFYYCTGLTSVTIPNSVTSIEVSAFTIPNSVTSIGYQAFSGCSGLTSIEIPNSVTSIEGYAFNNCTGLTSVTINSNAIASKTYTSSSSMKDIFGKQVNQYVLGDSVKSIGGSAFSGCTGLTSIEIPNSVTRIGYEAFSYCRVTIPNSVTSIGYQAFSGCSGLTSIEIPNSVTSIGYSAFSGCSGLTSATIGNSVTSIEGYAFKNCTGLTSIEIPNSVTRIEYEAFSGCSGLTSIEIPNSVTSIGSEAFSDCSGLTSVTINSNAIASKTYTLSSSMKDIFGEQVNQYVLGDSVKSIGVYAFCSCSSLTSVTIPNSVTSIGREAFSYCRGLTKVIVNDIAAWCNISFAYNDSNPLIYAKHLYSDANTEITDLVIPDGVTSIEGYAFYNCTGLTSIEIPNSVTSIGREAFYNCTGLTKVIVNDIAAWCNISFSSNPLSYAKHLYSDANTEITDLVIPDGVTSIGYQAFYNCTGLTSVTIGNSVTSIGYKAFYNCTGLTSIEIPNSVTSIGEAAFSGCSGLTSVTIGNSVTSIGGSAFYGCSGLTDIYCHIKEPLIIDSSVFRDVPKNTCTLHVPVGSKNRYKSEYIYLSYYNKFSNFWREFLNIVEFDATGIVSIDNSPSTTGNDVWFTLNGVRLNGKPTKAGIYIVNGKKVVIK